MIYRLTSTEILFGLQLLVPITLHADDLHFGFGDLVDSCSRGFVFSWIRGFVDSSGFRGTPSIQLARIVSIVLI